MNSIDKLAKLNIMDPHARFDILATIMIELLDGQTVENEAVLSMID